MEGTMTYTAVGVSPDLWELVSRACNDTLRTEDQARLESLLSADDNGRRFYGYYMLMHGDLLWRFRDGAISAVEAEDILSASPASERPGIPVCFSTALYGAVGYFSAGWPVAYLVATVVFSIGLAIGAVVHVSEPVPIVRQSVPLPSSLSPVPSVVGRITGMADCKFEGGSGFRVQGSGAEDQESEIRNQKCLVALGDKLALSSGLMEITYDTGAKVVLQGPVTYEVESPAGGFLSLGKLTARVEGTKSQAANQKSEIRNHKLFAVRTPTATVTDLGTEFGVEVQQSGATEAKVLRGKIEVRRRSFGGQLGEIVRLTENEAVRLDGTSRRCVACLSFLSGLSP